MRYYQVTAKCGHVGRGKYYEGQFYVIADNGRAAADIVRMSPRVKHHHKDAILTVSKIGYDEYRSGKISCRKNPYFNCRNVQEQRQCLDDISTNIFTETHNNTCCFKRSDQEYYDWKVLLNVRLRRQRKDRKYGFSYDHITGVAA